MKHRNTVLWAINNKYEPETHLRETSIQKKVLFPWVFYFFPTEGGKTLSPFHNARAPSPGPARCQHGASTRPPARRIGHGMGWQRAPLLPAKMTKSWLAQPPPLPVYQGIGSAVPFKRCSLIINCGLSIQGADNGISQAPLHGQGGHRSRHGFLFNYCTAESVLEKRIEKYTKF